MFKINKGLSKPFKMSLILYPAIANKLHVHMKSNTYYMNTSFLKYKNQSVSKH